jgi:hypothetical protein
VHKFARLNKHLASAYHAYGACDHVSGIFLDQNMDARPVHVLGARHKMPRRDPMYQGYLNPDRQLYHVLVRIGRWYIDFTYRQFDRIAPHPMIMRKRDLRRIWCRVSSQELI